MRVGVRPGLLAALAVSMLALAGCPSGPAVREDLALAPDPIAALTAYRDALGAGRLADAFAFIHPEAREGLDLGGFSALYGRHKEALIAQAEALLARARASKPAQRARVTTSQGEVELERTPEGWRLLTPVGPAAAAPDDGALPAAPRTP
jgi:hypothetical protein